MINNHWTGIETRALREAMSLTLEKFASAVGLSARTVRLWESQGADTSMRMASRAQVDKALSRASADVVERFEQADRGHPRRTGRTGRRVPA
ncbi:DNA-binding transcriptional regulator [Nocardia sp. CNY236]|uniref:helix-turn-helix domain-containing protein n=1 Tax=Nocardia sp. CNY236 TaxID=1169152 RepID=UPI000403E92B|nr:hypothetical protein [Nocardia sp. CNY236]